MESAAQDQVLVKIEPWDTESVEDAPSIPVFIKDEPPSDDSVEVRSSCLDVSVKEEILNTEGSCSNAMEIPLDDTVKVERVREKCGAPAVSPSGAAPSSPVLLKVKPLSDGSVEFWFSCVDEPVKEEILNTEASCSNGIETPLDKIVKVERVKECGVSARAAAEGLYAGHAITDKVMLGPIPVEHRNINTKGRAPQEEKDKSLVTYRCEHCRFTTTKKCGLSGHMRIHARHFTPVSKTEHTEKPYKFDQRTYATARKSSLLVHKKEHTGEKPYKCSQCSFSAVTKSHLISHVMTHIGEIPFKCDECSFIAKGKYGLQAHKRVHEPYKCGQCSYASNYSGNLKKHERRHVREKVYRCDQCSFFASSKQSVNLHHRHAHTENRFKCSLCNYSAALEYSLLIHKKRHTGENQYKCSKCSFTTPRESELISHEIMHIGEKPHKSDDNLSNHKYKCAQCNFTTIMLRGLKCHEKIHNGEKQDSVASSDNNKLSDHEEIHTEASSTSTPLTVEHEDT